MLIVIRCDANMRQPCTNCLQRGKDCSFSEASRKRGPQKGYIESLESRLRTMEDLLQDIVENSRNPVHEKQDNILHRPKGKIVRYHGSSAGYHLVSNLFSSTSADNQEEGAMPITDTRDEQPKVFHIPFFYKKSAFRIKAVGTNGDEFVVVRDTTEDEEAERLEADGQEIVDAFIPRSLISNLIYIYFSSDPLLPIVDKDDFMRTFEGKALHSLAPLLVYAICTFSCSLVSSDDPMFREAGLERDELYRLLNDRAAALVRRGYLLPRASTIQALVLFASHPDYTSTSHNSWIKAGMAAQDLGLHRTVNTANALESIKIRKRLWYSVYVTDRWCSAIMGRPLAILDSECDVDLKVTDVLWPGEDLSIFIYFMKLSRILGEVLRRVYLTKTAASEYRTMAMEQTVWNLQMMLEEWYFSVPDNCKITEVDLMQLSVNPRLYAGSKKITHGGPLTLCYYAVTILLHRPFLSVEEAGMPFVTKSAAICIKTAKLGIDIAQKIPSKSMISFGWNFTCYSVFVAALIHAYNTKSNNPEIANEAKEYLRKATDDVLEPMVRDVPSKPPVVDFLRTIPSLFGDTPARPVHFTQQETKPVTPMSVQHILSEQAEQRDTTTMPSLSEKQSWLLNSSEEICWEDLFSTIGNTFSEDTTGEGSGFEGCAMDDYI
ncbi:hypothetical protein RMCBS344292_11293 [Rhizopus microsporus]|nr:hypothetical protein RMCBS344292_11293 [Rhizopus microsporus]